MNRILKDFVNCASTISGCGFFEGDHLACETARGMSTNQIRKLQRYDIVPKSFFTYLVRSEIIQGIPKQPMMVGELLTFLRFYPYENERARVMPTFRRQRREEKMCQRKRRL